MLGMTATMMSSLSGSIQRPLAAHPALVKTGCLQASAGLSIKTSGSKGGYLNQYLNSGTSANNIMHHLIMGSLFIKF